MRCPGRFQGHDRRFQRAPHTPRGPRQANGRVDRVHRAAFPTESGRFQKPRSSMIAFCLAAVMLSDAPAPPEDRGVGYRWMKVTDEAAFAPRDGAGALTFRGWMWLIGGWNPGDKVHFPRICSNDVWS